MNGAPSQSLESAVAVSAGRPDLEKYDTFVIGAFRYPHGDASAQRLLTLAQAVSSGGRHPLVINEGDSNAPDGYRPGDVARAGGVDFVCLAGPRGGAVRRFVHRASRPLRLARLIRQHRRPGCRSSAVIASGLCTLGTFVVLGLLGVRVVPDVVERHDPEQFSHGRRTPHFIRHRWTSWLSSVLATRAIVISTRLARDFGRRGRSPLVVPALVDLSEYPADLSDAEASTTVTLVYFGTPTNKDRLGVVLDAISEIPEPLRQRLRFVIAGSNMSQLEMNPDVGLERLSKVSEVVDARGYVPRREVLEYLRAADFSVLLRPTGGYADAGFPTKVAESLAAGCPVLGNITSDLGAYLVDGRNAVICPVAPGAREVSVSTLREAIARTLDMSYADRHSMRQEARLSAGALSAAAWGVRVTQYLEAES